MENSQDIWCGKMYPERSVQTKGKISGASLKRQQKLQTKEPLFLDMRNGHLQDASWVTGGALLGGYTMHSFGEFPSEERGSRLSQILEATPHPKYCLSAKACLGILRRAEKRGKELPPMLKEALERQAGLSVSKNEPESPGGGKGILIQNERTGALSTLNNQRVCCLQGSMIGREDKNGPRGMAVVYDARGNGDGNTSPTLTGDHQNRVTDYTAIAVVGEPYHSSKNSYHTDFKNDSAADTLVATDYKDPPTVCEGPEYIVRRLTPLECERLQGYPDGWTNIGEWVDSKGKRHKDTDSPCYKALGNSIALPFWQYLANKMVKYLNKPTMGSLFDGISGFCLVFARAGANPIFASEIEEFPIAVAKQHFGDDNSGEVGDYAKYL